MRSTVPGPSLLPQAPPVPGPLLPPLSQVSRLVREVGRSCPPTSGAQTGASVRVALATCSLHCQGHLPAPGDDRHHRGLSPPFLTARSVGDGDRAVCDVQQARWRWGEGEAQ